MAKAVAKAVPKASPEIEAMRAANEAEMVEAVRRLALVVREGLKGTTLALSQVGIELTARMKQTLSTPGRGRLYRGRRGRGDHQASLAGDPPAPDTGQYRSSMTWRVGKQGDQAYVDVGTNQQRATYLEFGTTDIEPRPHFRPTIDEYATSLGARIRTAMESAERGAIAKLPRQKL